MSRYSYFPRSTARKKHYWEYDFFLTQPNEKPYHEVMTIQVDPDTEEYIVHVKYTLDNGDYHQVDIRRYKTFRSAEKTLLQFGKACIDMIHDVQAFAELTGGPAREGWVRFQETT